MGGWEREKERETHLPRITQRHHVVDVDVAGCSPCSAVVGAEPRSRSCCACTASNDICAVALEDFLACVAGSRLGDPVREKITGVPSLRALGGDSETSELCGSSGFAGNVGGSASVEDGWCWGSGDEGG